MGATYWLLPRLLGRELRFPGLARLQPYLWFLGMAFFSTSYHIAGLRGLPRRVFSASLNGEATTPWHTLTLVGAVGGVILFLSALSFLAVVLATWLSRQRIAAPAFEFAVPLRPATSLGLWDRFGWWTVLAVLLVAAAYAYPVFTLLAHPRYGSPGVRLFSGLPAEWLSPSRMLMLPGRPARSNELRSYGRQKRADNAGLRSGTDELVDTSPAARFYAAPASVSVGADPASPSAKCRGGFPSSRCGDLREVSPPSFWRVEPYPSKH